MKRRLSTRNSSLYSFHKLKIQHGMHTYSGDSAQVLIAFSLENCAMYYLSSFVEAIQAHESSVLLGVFGWYAWLKQLVFKFCDTVLPVDTKKDTSKSDRENAGLHQVSERRSQDAGNI